MKLISMIAHIETHKLEDVIMNDSKGYFQFSAQNDGVYITVYPPKNGGKKASLDDAMYYMEKRKILDCSLIKMKEAFFAKDEAKTVKISDTKMSPISEFGDYRISLDCMRVEVVFYPPFEGANILSEAEIIRDLENIGIKYEINRSEIQNFLQNRDYGKSYVLASGKEPREGADGKVEYRFNVDLKPTPKVNVDGTVDFHSLENVNHIQAGDIVAEMIPEDKGDAGFDVMGRSVNPRVVKRAVLRGGKNLKISDDGLQLISLVSGHVSLEYDKIVVSNVLEIINVDNSSGDIDYQGNVSIQGNVLAGFSVRASGNIAVNGVVEGATLIAGGDITIARGIQGMNRAVVEAKGNIVTKFIESAKSIVASGNIETDTILHSKVIAKGKIVAKGRNGLIIGGDVKSSILIEADTIGTEMGTSTIVGVGVDPAIKKRIDELKSELITLGNNKIKLAQLLLALRKKQESEGSLSPEKQQLQQKTMRSLILLEQELLKSKQELEECRSELSEDGSAKIKVYRTAYVGTKFVFGEQYLFIREKFDHCQFMKVGADIKGLPL